ncbi:MAG: divergent polysaccharide deacetylase family protein, partial [Alphaproteobacteria bacterium]|nr:divergent polysaccharide deacetylase family protein [Alphaproteobacteria bacterium]
YPELEPYGLDVVEEPGAGLVIPSVTAASFKGLTPWPRVDALTPAPDKTLVEQSDFGLLPKVGEDGFTPFDAYARPEPEAKDAVPQIAIVITGVGTSRAATEAAITGTPANVALALDVYARGVEFWMSRSRDLGHEVLLGMPSEPSDFPFTDPGPSALLSLAPPEENMKQLHWMLTRATGYFGVLSLYGSKFLTVEDQLKPILGELKKRGLMYVDGGAEDSLAPRVAFKEKMRWAMVDIELDANPGRADIDEQLKAFEELAKKRSKAIARISATPLALQRLGLWLNELEAKGLQLVPVSSLANKQIIR